MRYKGMTFDKMANSFRVTSDNGAYFDFFPLTEEGYREAQSWIFEMADNNDIGAEFNRRISKKYCKEFGTL